MVNHSNLKRILCIEDDPEIQAVLNMSLSTLGQFEIKLASSPDDAMVCLPGFDVQLILLDIMVRGLDMSAMLESIKNIALDIPIPVILVTSKPNHVPAEIYKHQNVIGIIAKPFDIKGLPQQINDLWLRRYPELKVSARIADKVQEQLSKMAGTFGESLPQRVDTLEHLWIQGLGDKSQLSLAIAEAHKLAGAGGTFGYFSLSFWMQEIEKAAYELLETNESRAVDVIGKRVAILISKVRQSGMVPESDVKSLLEQDPRTLLKAPTSRRQKLVYVADDDEAFGHAISAQIQQFGYEVEYFSSVNALRKAIGVAQPAAVLLDIDFPEDRTAGPIFMKELREHEGKLFPTIYISNHAHMNARLQAVKAGGMGYFCKPVDAGELVDRLDILLDDKEVEPYRVIIIDDEQTTLKFFSMLLRQRGMEVREVSDPMKALDVIRDFNPELIIIDMYMPKVNGRELAAVLRQEPSLLSTPIVFLSAEQDLQKQISAMREGADDFLTKPIQPQYLINAVSIRIDRYRELRSLMTMDSLTGLLNHSRLLDRLNFELSRAYRSKNPLALAMLDLDHFKEINDTYGHSVGDMVIKSISRILKDRLRKTDVIGRYGGEEFAVILPDTELEDAMRIMNQMRDVFAQVPQNAGKETFFCTFSCGIAQYDNDLAPNLQIIDAADKAMYAAKQYGRNRVEISN